jgi:hypothetical protein
MGCWLGVADRSPDFFTRGKMVFDNLEPCQANAFLYNLDTDLNSSLVKDNQWIKNHARIAVT